MQQISQPGTSGRGKMETGRRGFTLIELLVVVAVISILIGILLPALGAARAEANAAVAASNQRQVAQAVATYVADAQFFPPAYVYGNNETGTSWVEEDQLVTGTGNPVPTRGYVHWSVALFDDLSLNIEAFEAPVLPDGGAPATNPGPDSTDWAVNQIDNAGNTSTSPPAEFPEDRQAKRVAFAGNHAIFPRNKFVRNNPTSTNPPRLNTLVRAGRITDEARTILAGEFTGSNDYRALATNSGGGENGPVLIGSHRPITPFVGFGGQGGGTWSSVYDESLQTTAEFAFYYPEDDLFDTLEADADLTPTGVLETTPPRALGQHYKGRKANYVFADGHVERLTIRETFERFLWGDRFYTITGPNRVFRGPWTEAE